MNITEQLRRAQRLPPSPLKLTIANGSELIIRQWLRILPAKRLVGQGELEGKQVLAKLFIAPAAERHCIRELDGVQAVLDAGIATPGIVGHGEIPDGGRYLLTEFLEDAQSLETEWETLSDHPAGSEPAMQLLRLALSGIAAMHAKGLVQRDLHLGNFLLHQRVLQVIDGDAVEVLSQDQPVTAQQAEENLAVFFAQLNPEWDEWVEQLLLAYLDTNPHRPIHTENLAALIRTKRRLRLENYLDKSLRDCTEFAVKRSWRRFEVCRRSELAALEPILAQPDAVFGDQLLKDGGSSTVTKAEIGSRPVVVKRYNIKGKRHWLKRFWRPSRAWHSWLASHRLEFLGIPTPRSLGMVEERLGPFRSRAWLINEYCPGRDLLAELGTEGDCLPSPELQAALISTFSGLVNAQISHGDCKATNLLWHQGAVVLIDLDAMTVYSNEAQWKRAWAKDRARFIRNWPVNSPLALWLEQALPRPM
ncbi:lipopolysaccharide kinase InaA family protein [Pseudomonas saliphila]|uniref:lipopolysaccharide kinase InaA family protein n=1 Tax=Pseudomonas saliphila TaxID=2586906 RepID=UPI0012385AA4|nr:lipopolysaccharide kinase InaA family protein [Pseudomonas saliphila]